MKITISITDCDDLVSRVFFSKHCEGLALGKTPKGILMPNTRLSLIEGTNFEGHLANINLKCRDTFDKGRAYKGAHYVNNATLPDCDPKNNYFSGSSIEAVMQNVTTTKPSRKMAIKPATPVGYTQKTQQFLGSKILTRVYE